MEKEGKKTKRTQKEAKTKKPLSIVKLNLKRLSYEELEQVIALAMRYRKERLGSEELRLLKEKEELELKLKDLKKTDEKLNAH